MKRAYEYIPAEYLVRLVHLCLCKLIIWYITSHTKRIFSLLLHNILSGLYYLLSFLLPSSTSEPREMDTRSIFISGFRNNFQPPSSFFSFKSIAPQLFELASALS
ncbi:hypothetical protein NC653_034240 [Populus alba x Populus x berolinensis]|uniref:Uncharacterized protein n=1 Tax=Populus alba x Populus x berolinensis TaxID=444605 RepID=A0AAD6LMC0_9ROSI|nr:hypothetical protein NC653_034240 [Populus alba x Populus x berolinensis]